MSSAPTDTPFGSTNLGFVEELYARFLEDPSSVDASWRDLFTASRSNDGDLRAARTAVDGPSFPRASLFDPPGASVAPPEILGEYNLPEFPAAELDERQRYLRGIKMFASLPDEELRLVARLGKERRVADGEVLFREGDPGNALYMMLKGHLIKKRSGRVVSTLNPGEVVGELAVLDDRPRTCEVIAHGEALVIEVDRADMLALLSARPQLARAVSQVLASRLRQRSTRQDRVDQLINAYRDLGHLEASLDPLSRERPRIEELRLEHYGLSEDDLDSLFSTTAVGGGTVALTLREIVELMRASYCGSIGVQFMHIDATGAKQWLIERLEDRSRERRLEREEQLRVLEDLTKAEIFEQFIHKKFLGAKRFSLEGAETLIPLLGLALDEAGRQGVREAVLGMAHRGRLNVLVNILKKDPSKVFREFADEDPEAYLGAGDVKYHLGYSSTWNPPQGEDLHVSLCFNPSHLEFVNPVVMGRVRAKQDRYGDTERRHCLAIAIHGDAAFAGQGVTQEILNMAELEGYRVGGTLHIIVNNQIGFTTLPEDGRSTRYATEVVRMLQTPIFHVNGEDPAAVAQVVRLAMDYRAEFETDVVIDMYCYRRYGHNETDEPAYTNPLMYERIRQLDSTRKHFVERLGLENEAKALRAERRKFLDNELAQSRSDEYEMRGPSSGEGLWSAYRGGLDADTPRVPTTVDQDRLAFLLERQTELPESFRLHKKLQRIIDDRRAMARGEKPLDWGAAEALAFASLLAEGAPVRLTGQDCGRGTFSHRHAILHDAEDGHHYVPLSHLVDGQARFEIYDSPLSEVGVLGFEWGYSLDTPEGLTLWEAQFGDFSNVGQVIIDQFITSSEDKWKRLSGLVMLLPHGFEGQGPEHSSARLERFLNMCAEDNIQVVNLTTPAQFFHCLRRQVVRAWRKPLIVMSPKSLLRLPAATSTLEDLADGDFLRVLEDPAKPDPTQVRKVLLTSGKLYYELEAERAEREADDIAILRLEQYYPLDKELLEEELGRYPDGLPVAWVQEEPKNMGAWSFIQLHLIEAGSVFDRWPIHYVGREPSASPATGSAAAHRYEQKRLIDEAFS